MIYRDYLKDKNQNSIKFKEVEGSSPLAFSHSKGRDLKNYQIYGNSTQKTTGKNILPYPFADTTRTIYGITFTDNKDGTIALNGTSTFSTTTSIADFYLCRNISISAGTYTLSGCPSGGSTYKYRLMMSIKKSGGTTAYSSDIGQGYSFTVDTDATVTLTIRIGGEIGTVSNLVFKPQLEKGSTATDYEAYHTSPSPEFPSEIESVGDLTTKNLLDYTTVSTRSGTTAAFIDNGFVYTGNYYFAFDGSFLEIGSTYVMSWNFEGDDTLTPTWRLAYEDGTYSNIVRNGVSLKIAQSVSKILVYPEMSKTTYTTTFTNIQLELGSTATAYEPYHKYDIPISIYGKNLIKYPYQYTTRDINGIRFTDNGDGSVTMNGKATANAIWFMYLNRTNLIGGLSSGDKITLSVKSNKSFSGALRVVCNYFDTGGTEKDANMSITAANSSRTNKITALWKGMEIYIVVLKGQTVDNVTIYPQLEKGSPATSYEPYKGKTTKHIYLDEPLRKIGDYADYIDFKNQKVVRCIGEITLDGTENWVYQESNNIIYLSIKNKNLSRTHDSFSTHFLFQDSKNAIDPYFVVVNSSTLGNVVLRFYQQGDNIIYSTADEFKTFLVDQYNSGNPVKLLCNCYNVVETAVTIPNLAAPKSERATIMVDTSIKPSNMKIKYIRM